VGVKIPSGCSQNCKQLRGYFLPYAVGRLRCGSEERKPQAIAICVINFQALPDLCGHNTSESQRDGQTSYGVNVALSTMCNDW